MKSTIKYKTLFPEYYETFVFDDMLIPEADNFLYAPLVTFRVFDKDNFDLDDIIGSCAFFLDKAVRTEDPDEPLPDPIWTPLFIQAPGDGDGEILVNVQLIPTMNNPHSDKIKNPPLSITPETKDAFIDIIAVGMRDMAPFHFQPIQSPFLEIELMSTGNHYLQATAPSKRPTASNPNFLQQLLLPCKLPLKSIFATPLQLRAKDTRLGGFSKPVVGVGSIDLVHKLPWCVDTYKAPQTDIFFTAGPDPNLIPLNDNDLDTTNLDETGLEALKMQQARIENLADDDFIAMQEPAKIEALLK
jgi:hypothetical protein